MSAPATRNGHCVCGAVSVTVPYSLTSVSACHCTMCRRWGGGPYMEVDAGTEAIFSGDEHVQVYPSSDWAERGFCSRCGSHLFYRLKESGQHMVAIGLFDDSDGLTFERQVFIDEKPAFYHFGNSTDNKTGAELFALYSPPDAGGD